MEVPVQLFSCILFTYPPMLAIDVLASVFLPVLLSEQLQRAQTRTLFASFGVFVTSLAYVRLLGILLA